MVRQGILDDLYKRNREALASREERIRVLEDEVARLHAFEFPIRELARELAALYPDLVTAGAGREVKSADASSDAAPSIVVVTSWRRLPTAVEQEKLRAFLAARLGVESVRLVAATAQ